MFWSYFKYWNQTGCSCITLHWRHNDWGGVSDYQSHGCLLSHLFWRRSKKASKLRVTGLCEGNSPVTGEFPAQRASNAENVSIWWRHHGMHLSSDLTEGKREPYYQCFIVALLSFAQVILIPPEMAATVARAPGPLTTYCDRFARWRSAWNRKGMRPTIAKPTVWRTTKVYISRAESRFAPANERHRYFVTTSLIGWVQA